MDNTQYGSKVRLGVMVDGEYVELDDCAVVQLNTGNGWVDMGADEFHCHLYWVGDAVPGVTVQGKLVGEPGTSQVGLWLGSGVLDPDQLSI